MISSLAPPPVGCMEAATMNSLLSIPVHIYDRARRLIRSMQYSAALQPLGQLELLNLSPRHAAAVQRLLGVCYLHLRKPRRAARHLRAAARLAPSDARTHALLGRVAASPA